MVLFLTANMVAVMSRANQYRGYYMAAAEIPNFSSSVEKHFISERSERVNYIFNTRREISYLQMAM